MVWTAPLHHLEISIPYVPDGNSRDRVGVGGEGNMPEGKGNIFPGAVLIRYDVPY